jgi:hypothetical protein
MKPTRRTVVLGLTAAAALLLGTLIGCGGGEPKPGEDDLLPETGLTYPGATETYRGFLPAEDARSIEGPDLSNDARLTRKMSLPAPTPVVDILDWYREQFENNGWKLGIAAPESVSYSKMADGWQHHCAVKASTDAPNATTERYVVSCFMNRPPDG